MSTATETNSTDNNAQLWDDIRKVRARRYHLGFMRYCWRNQDHVKAYWDGLTATSTEATSHKSQSDRKKEIDDARVSAKKKLAALGLTDTEIKALGIGV